MTDDQHPHQSLAGRLNSIKRFLKVLGPGLITGASDDDPSGIATYSLAGASFGYLTLWTALVTFPLMAAVQFICAKIGMVSGMGLAGIMRRHYSRWLVVPAILALVVANTVNAAADIQAVAAGINLLVPISITVLIAPIALSILIIQIWGSYRLIANIFKWLTISLLAYIGAGFLAKPNWSQVALGTIVPTIRLDRDFLSLLIAILGTTISPYLFFWQASQEVDEQKAMGRKKLWQRQGATNTELKHAAWDVNAGMFLSNIVMYFIILATAATLHAAGTTQIDTATQAAEALRPIAGRGAYVLMALGLIGTGVLAIPILTGSAAYSVAEMLNWKCGLDEKPVAAKEFYLVIAACTVGALALNFIGVNPIKALFWTAMINGFLSPPMLIFVMLIANNRNVMGKRSNGIILNVLGGATTILMFAAAAGLVWTWTQ